jgi:hypothetical protein
VKLMRSDPLDLFTIEALHYHHIGCGQDFNPNLVLGAKDYFLVRHALAQNINTLAVAIGILPSQPITFDETCKVGTGRICPEKPHLLPQC